MPTRRRRDNSAVGLKLHARREAARGLGDDAHVLELLCGDGQMYELLWSRYPRGATMDRSRPKVERAAVERPTWAVYHGDAIAALRGGWMSHVAWDVVDIDAYGSPWPFLRAWYESSRSRAPSTRIALTDGYMARASISHSGCRALFDGRCPGGLTREQYMAEVECRLRGWGDRHGLELRSIQTWTHGMMACHLIVIDDRRQ